MKFDKDKFVFLYSNEYGTLNEKQKAGILFLLSSFEKDESMADIRWISYCLSTIKHECAGTWQPIEEYGQGKGMKYGNPDPETGQVYFGRGFVQLTWADNYVSMGRALNLDLYHKPELALDPIIAYEIMSLGMRRGSFTGKRLLDYINKDMCSYVLARKIINGTDQAEKIAGYATTIEAMLTEALC